jgi:isopenicillin-N epimerase
LREAREYVAARMNADAADIVFVTNATVGVNIVARSLDLGPGDEVLGTDHEYGACDRVWRFLGGKKGFSYRHAEIPVPVTSHEDMLDQLFSAVTPATRVLFISHITSPTALTFPIAEACRRAREMGLITIVDGAHVPGQLPLDLTAIDADYYTGNFHKWVCSPKGSAFLYARKSAQPALEPLVVSWGWEAVEPGESEFIDHHQYRGTRDLAAALTVPAAWDFQDHYNWDEVRQRCHEMIRQARPELIELLDAEPIGPDSDEWYAQMMAFRLPKEIDGVELQRRLWEEHLVEIPVFPWNGRQTIRISVQGYTRWSEVERLIAGVREKV